MSQRCTVCYHAHRDAIDRALVTASASNRAIATLHALSEAAVRRHKDAHLPDILRLTHQEDEAAHEVDLQILVRRLVADAHRIRRRAEEQGDLRTALMGLRELTRLIELAVSTGQVQPEPEQGRVVRVVWDMGSDPLPRSEQPATASFPPPSSAAQRVVAVDIVNSTSLDNNARAESQSKARVRRRQYSGIGIRDHAGGCVRGCALTTNSSDPSGGGRRHGGTSHRRSSTQTKRLNIRQRRAGPRRGLTNTACGKAVATELDGQSWEATNGTSG